MNGIEKITARIQEDSQKEIDAILAEAEAKAAEITAQAQAEAKAAGEQILTEYLHTLVDPYGTVESTLCTARQKGDTLLVTLTAECQEQIGESVPIYTENPG